MTIEFAKGDSKLTAGEFYTDKPKTFCEAADLILDEMRETLWKKQRDYGPGNISDFGELGVLVRANDKMARLKNLHKAGIAPSNESVEDSWLDLANYAVIALMLRRGIWGLPVEGK